MRDVSFGQYYPTDSFVHKCDPRIKLIFLIAYIVMLFVAKSFYALGGCAVVFLLTVIFSEVPLKSLLRSTRAVLFLLLFTAVLNLFFRSGTSEPLVAWKFIKIYKEGIYYTVFLAARLILLVLGSAVLTLTTTPVALTDGIESLLYPFKLIRFPVHELALITSIALRFIPILSDETGRIMNAQKARGADFETGGLVKRVKAFLPVLIPLLVSAFRRADELGDAMDARCYSGSKVRTKYKKLAFGWRDLVVFLLMAAMIAGGVLMRVYLPALV